MGAAKRHVWLPWARYAVRTAIFCWLACLPSLMDQSRAAPPNIVLIMVDDMGYSDIGCYGSEIRTPHIDSLAARGLRFTQFYNNAKCTTTRASLLTGLYPRPDGPLLRTSLLTLGEALQPAGYQTALSGKWHLGRATTTHPHHRGFDEFYGLLDGCCNFFNPQLPDPQFKGGRVRFWGHNAERVTSFPQNFYATDAIAEHAAATIRRYAASERPFLAHVCFTAPHYPLHAPPEDIDRYRDHYRLGWEVLRTRRRQRQLELGLIDPRWPAAPRDSLVTAWEAVPAAHRSWQARRMAVYAAMVDRVDQGVGRILQALRETGVEDHTLVLFLSDNGGCAEQFSDDVPERMPGTADVYATVGPDWAWAQNTPFRRFKAWVHEGGISTPLIACWPGNIAAGTQTDQVGHVIDVLPTCLELAGTDYPSAHDGHVLLPVEGRSLVPILQQQPREPPARLFWEWGGHRAVRAGQWKLIWDDTVRRWELYDMQADRTETRDVSAEHPERVLELAADWQAWAARTGVIRPRTARSGPRPGPGPGDN